MKKRILFLDTPLSPPGGGQMSLLLMLQNIDKAQFDPFVYVSKDSEFVDWIKRELIPVSIVSLRHLFFKIKELRPDIIHCNCATTKYAFVAVVSARLLRIPFIWHVRVVETAGWKDKIIASLATKIIAISEVVCKKFSWINNKDKVVTIYNAADTAVFHPGLEIENFFHEFSIGRESPVVGIFSRLDPWKGHMLFLESAKEIIKQRPQAKFLIVGEGEESYKEKLNAFIQENNLWENVIFTGFRKDIPFLMNLCKVIVNPSIEPEPFGRTIIEAMACGVPVVATNIGGPKEIIQDGENGFLVAPKAQQMISAVDMILDDEPLASRISQKALESISQRFSVKKHLEQIELLYKDFDKGERA